MDTIKKIINLLFRKIKKEKQISFFALFLVFTLIILSFFAKNFLVEIPKEGGEVHEIFLKEKPRFINPVLAITNIDKSLISLIYSPLFYKDKEGNLVDNIASYEIANFGKKYILKLKDNIYFHDGKKLTADDVIFTIQQIQNPENNSFYRPEWVGVETKKINDLSLELNLPKENYYFKDSLVLYVLPKHIWENIEYFNLDDKNLNPIGSGPFKIKEVVWDNNSSKKIKSIILSKNKNYFGGKIWLDNIYFDFFENKKSFIDSYIFKNKQKNKNLFSYDKINELENKYNKINIDEPININLTIKNNNSNKFLNNLNIRKFIFKTWLAKNDKEIKENLFKLIKNKDFSYDEKNNLLKYKKEIISFSLITKKNKDLSLINLAEKFKDKMRKVGIAVKIKVLNDNDYINIYRERSFESIISEYYVNEKYWFYYYHSSQKNDPWINIAQFNSSKIDSILTELKNNLSTIERNKKKKELEKELENYSLVLTLEKGKSYYYLSKDIQNMQLEKINSGENRFRFVKDWVVLTEKILPIFKD